MGQNNEKIINEKKEVKNLILAGLCVGVGSAMIGYAFGYSSGFNYAGKVVDKGFDVLFKSNPGFKEQFIDALQKAYKDKIAEGLK